MSPKEPQPWLLTPGPLTTSASVKEAMLLDWGSREPRFIAMTAEVCARLLTLAGAPSGHVCVPMQGSGTFSVEAMIGACVPRDGHLLVLINGAYGRRAAAICDYYDRRCSRLEWPEDQPVDARALEERLADDASVTHVLVVHCETTSGILNPLERVAEVCARRGPALLVDAMSSFGALPLDANAIAFDALAASSNKCLEGVPGLGFVILREAALAAGQANSLSLDLHAQLHAMRGNGQWRFTPPTHVLAALRQALLEHEAEGGVAGRGARYRRNCEVLAEGMRALGFQTLLPDALQAPIIVTFRMPADPRFEFERFYDALARRGFIIYPGKLTVAPSFRIGCIGRLGEAEMRAALDAVREVLAELGVASGAP